MHRFPGLSNPSQLLDQRIIKVETKPICSHLFLSIKKIAHTHRKYEIVIPFYLILLSRSYTFI